MHYLALFNKDYPSVGSKPHKLILFMCMENNSLFWLIDTFIWDIYINCEFIANADCPILLCECKCFYSRYRDAATMSTQPLH